MKKEFCVIGVGRFGVSLIKFLSEKGADIVAIDKDEEKLIEVQDHVVESYVMDITNEKNLLSLDISQFTGIIIAISTDIEASIMGALLLKEMGAKNIIARARDELHKRILEKIGVNRIVFPEKEMAEKLAQNLISPGLFDIIEISDKYVLEERIAPFEFKNKTLAEIGFRSKYGINIIAIKRKIPDVNSKGETILKEQIVIGPGGNEEIKEGDILFVLGDKKKVEEVFKK